MVNSAKMAAKRKGKKKTECLGIMKQRECEWDEWWSERLSWRRCRMLTTSCCLMKTPWDPECNLPPDWFVVSRKATQSQLIQRKCSPNKQHNNERESATRTADHQRTGEAWEVKVQIWPINKQKHASLLRLFRVKTPLFTINSLTF